METCKHDYFLHIFKSPRNILGELVHIKVFKCSKCNHKYTEIKGKLYKSLGK